MANSTENKYGHYGGDISIFEDIKEYALMGKGRGFSYSFNIPAETTTFEWHTSWIGNHWKKVSSSCAGEYLQYEKDKASLREKGYLGISYKEYPKQLRDDRHNAERFKRKEAHLSTGFVVTVSVDDITAKLIYEDTLRMAKDFKDYLLTSREDILELIVSADAIRRPQYGQYKYYISTHAIYSYNPPKIYYHDPEETPGVCVCSFTKMQLKPLKGIEQCYGLGTALVEYVLKTIPYNFENYQVFDRSVRPCGPNYYYIVEVSLQKKEEQLNSW